MDTGRWRADADVGRCRVVRPGLLTHSSRVVAVAGEGCRRRRISVTLTTTCESGRFQAFDMAGRFTV
jgi:hypothetical protein